MTRLGPVKSVFNIPANVEFQIAGHLVEQGHDSSGLRGIVET